MAESITIELDLPSTPQAPTAVVVITEKVLTADTWTVDPGNALLFPSGTTVAIVEDNIPMIVLKTGGGDSWSAKLHFLILDPDPETNPPATGKAVINNPPVESPFQSVPVRWTVKNVT